MYVRLAGAVILLVCSVLVVRFRISDSQREQRSSFRQLQRLDVRSEKDWAFRRWKLALYGEVLNLTNHDNRRYFYAAQNPDGTFTVVTRQGLPITPTAGVAFEF